MNPFEMFRSKVAVRDDFSDLDANAQAAAYQSALTQTRESRLLRDLEEEEKLHARTREQLADARRNYSYMAADRAALFNTMEYLRQRWGKGDADQAFDEAEKYRRDCLTRGSANEEWMAAARDGATRARAGVDEVADEAPIGPTKLAAKKAAKEKAKNNNQPG